MFFFHIQIMSTSRWSEVKKLLAYLVLEIEMFPVFRIDEDEIFPARQEAV